MILLQDQAGKALRAEFSHSERMPFQGGEHNREHDHRGNKEQHVIYYHSGQGRIYLVDRWYTIAPGEVYLVDAETLHNFSAARKDPHTYLEATFVLHPHRPLTGLIEELAGGAPWPTPFKLDARGRELVEGALDVLRAEARETQGKGALVELRIWDLILTLARVHADAAAQAAPRPAGPPPTGRQLVEQVNLYLRRNFRRPLALEELAAYVRRSASTVAHTYKKLTRRSIGEELRLQRLTRAKELLRNSDYAIGRIADLCGFGDAAHFSRIFKKEEKQTPREYRARILGNGEENAKRKT
ncbi:MAG: AraC family transcriptional regulator [Planctomycetota bacterium]|nr:AraC family transcriptional regulator [Planctomycetota bacterium]